MNELLYWIISLFGTIGFYLLGTYIYRRWTYPFLVPILTTTICIIVLLVCLKIPYDRYLEGAGWIDELLGPAVVALAYPLYLHRNLVSRYSVPLLTGIFTGVMIAVCTGYAFASLLGISEALRNTMLPKSVTTPVAMEIAEVTGGMPAIAVVFVMVAGIGGVILAPYLFKWIGLRTDLGKGIALGSASHAIGTAKSLEYGERAAAVSSVAMTLSALFSSILIPLFVFLTQ